jgi:hypothetical protein
MKIFSSVCIPRTFNEYVQRFEGKLKKKKKKDKIWRNKYLRTNPTVIIYESLTRPVLNYSPESRVGTTRMRQVEEIEID